MSCTAFRSHLAAQIEDIKSQGLFKEERVITTPQRAQIMTANKSVINLCANNYLGLADNSELIATAKRSLDSHGYGMASVRFICGTQAPHKELEKRLSGFLGME